MFKRQPYMSRDISKKQSKINLFSSKIKYESRFNQKERLLLTDPCLFLGPMHSRYYNVIVGLIMTMLVRSFKTEVCKIGGVKNKIDTCRPEVCMKIFLKILLSTSFLRSSLLIKRSMEGMEAHGRMGRNGVRM